MFRDLQPIPIKPDEFSGMTFQIRYPKILTDVINSDLFAPEITKRLTKLKDSLESERVIKLHQNDPDWDNFYQAYEGHRIIDLPFFDAEFYLFALIRDLVNYDILKIDPFAAIKSEDLSKNLLAFDSVMEKSRKWQTHDFLTNCLHGNKSDLSQLKHGADISINTLIDDSSELIKLLPQVKHIDVIMDNAGMELFSDLLLVDHLLSTYSLNVTLHIKSAPIFVSDVIEEDITKLLDFLGHHQDGFVNRIKVYLAEERLLIEAAPFWVSPKHFDEIPEGILQPNSLILSKGDANYRRFFGDRMITPTQPTAELTSYLHQPSFAIRTLKSDIQMNLNQEQFEELEANHPNWMNSGTFAVIQKMHG